MIFNRYIIMKRRKFQCYITENFPQKSQCRLLVLWMFLFIGLFSSKVVWAQDPQFSQFYSNPLYLNPAFAGTGTYPRIVSNYRNQWPSSGNTFVTYNLGYDQYVLGMKGAIGFQTLYDREINGSINTVQSSFCLLLSC